METETSAAHGAANGLEQELRHKINTRTKPLGSLGQLEDLALQLGLLQGTTQPRVVAPCMYVCAADHGLARRGVSAYPPEVTAQMVLNFLAGGAAINVFCRLNEVALKVVNAGVDHDFPAHDLLIDRPVGRGTADCSAGLAMSAAECAAALDLGASLTAQALAAGSTVIGFGEMGIGNSSSAALVGAAATGKVVAQMVGPGTGLDTAGLARKKAVLTECMNLHGKPHDPRDILQAYGGFEIAAMAGGMAAAAGTGLAVLVDGFICTAAALIAVKLVPECRKHMIFCHASSEPGHGHMLEALKARPLLDLGLHLGEGTGAALALPLLRAACAFLDQMASFEAAGVSGAD